MRNAQRKVEKSCFFFCWDLRNEKSCLFYFFGTCGMSTPCERVQNSCGDARHDFELSNHGCVHSAEHFRQELLKYTIF